MYCKFEDSAYTKEMPMAAILFFKMKLKIFFRQDTVTMNISWEFEISTYNTFCSGGVTKPFYKSRKTPVVTILFFKMRPKIFPDKILRGVAIFFVRVVTVKSLHTVAAA